MQAMRKRELKNKEIKKNKVRLRLELMELMCHRLECKTVPDRVKGLCIIHLSTTHGPEAPFVQSLRDKVARKNLAKA